MVRCLTSNHHLQQDGFEDSLAHGSSASNIHQWPDAGLLGWQSAAWGNLRSGRWPDLIRQKAENTLITLGEYLPHSPLSDRACRNIALRAELLKRKTPCTFAHLLGIEGSIAGDYFRNWSDLSKKWKPLKRYPIPSDWSAYRSRVALRHGIRLRNDGGGYNRGATHPVNAMLNYAYGVLIAQTQIRLIVEGYDPTSGIMHEKKALRGVNPTHRRRYVYGRGLLDSARWRLPHEFRAGSKSGAAFAGALRSRRQIEICVYAAA